MVKSATVTEEKEAIRYTTPDYEHLPPKEKIDRLEGLRNTAKKLTHISKLEKVLKDKYTSKVDYYNKLIEDTKKLLKT